MVIANINRTLNIYNSKIGILKGFVYKSGKYPPSLPEGCIVEMTDLDDIPPHLHFNELKNHVLIPPVSR